MQILIVYASIEGQSKKIAQSLHDFFKEQDISSSLLNADDAFRIPLKDYDIIMLAASVHHAEHKPAAYNFVRDNLEVLNSKPTCFLSVSLNAALPDEVHLKEADDYVKQFFSKTGWQPNDYLCVAGALRYNEMDYFRRELARTILQRTMGSTDVDLSCDYEYTDYEGLYGFIQQFLETVE